MQTNNQLEQVEKQLFDVDDHIKACRNDRIKACRDCEDEDSGELEKQCAERQQLQTEVSKLRKKEVLLLEQLLSLR